MSRNTRDIVRSQPGSREALAWGAEFVAFVMTTMYPAPTGSGSSSAGKQESAADIVFGLGACRGPRCRVGSSTRYFRPPEPDDRNRYGLPGWAGTYNVLIARRVLEHCRKRLPVSAAFALRWWGQRHVDWPKRRGSPMPAPIVGRGAGWEPHRMTVGGILRRGFQLGGSKVMIARAHLPAEQPQPGPVELAQARQGGPATSAGVEPPPDGRPTGRLAHALGEVRAWSGLRYDYYERRR